MLIKCPECGRAISDTAKSCNYCGYDLEARKQKIVEEKIDMNKALADVRKNGDEETQKIVDIMKSCGFGF